MQPFLRFKPSTDCSSSCLPNGHVHNCISKLMNNWCHFSSVPNFILFFCFQTVSRTGNTQLTNSWSNSQTMSLCTVSCHLVISVTEYIFLLHSFSSNFSLLRKSSISDFSRIIFYHEKKYDQPWGDFIYQKRCCLHMSKRFLALLLLLDLLLLGI